MRVRKVIGFEPKSGRPELGDYLLCCWQDCMRHGDDRHVIRTDGEYNRASGRTPTLVYVFCSEQHKVFYAYSHKDFGNVPDGYRAGHGLLRH